MIQEPIARRRCTRRNAILSIQLRLEKAIVSGRSRVNNWGCQPDRFTTDLSYPLAISDTTNAVSFRASFEPEGFIAREEAEHRGKWHDDNYAHVFQLKSFHGRELFIYDLKPKIWH